MKIKHPRLAAGSGRLRNEVRNSTSFFPIPTIALLGELTDKESREEEKISLLLSREPLNEIQINSLDFYGERAVENCAE